MPQGDKSAYTDKQKRKTEHIDEGYKDRVVSEKEAERRAWATVNKESGGSKKSGSGRGHAENHASSKKGGRKGGAAAASRTKEEHARPQRKRLQSLASVTNTICIIDRIRRHDSGTVSSMEEPSCRRRNPSKSGRRM